MPFDGLLIHKLTRDLSERLTGGRIDKIYQPEPDELLLRIRQGGGALNLFISIDPSTAYFSITEGTKGNPQNPPMFCMLLRKHLSGARILSLEQRGLDRVVKLGLEGYNDFGDRVTKELILEIMGKHSNLFLVDEKGKIIDALKRVPLAVSEKRPIMPGLFYEAFASDKVNLLVEAAAPHLETTANTRLVKYLYTTFEGLSPQSAEEICHRAHVDGTTPVSALDLNQRSTLSEVLMTCAELLEIPFEGGLYREDQEIRDLTWTPFSLYRDAGYQETLYQNPSDLVNAFYARRNLRHKINQKTHSLRKILTTHIDRIRSKMAKQEAELATANRAEDHKAFGEALYANLYAVEPGRSSLTVQDFYNPDEMLTIPLDPDLTPSENAQRHYKRYEKLKVAKAQLERQLAIARGDLAYLEATLETLETSVETEEEVDAIKEELRAEGFIKKKAPKGKKKRSKAAGPRRYLSSDGFEILAGRNNKQNDEVTQRIASNADLWFHTKEIHGSHVILRLAGREASETALVEAAEIAAYHSKARQSANVPVDYTEVRHVSKPSGARPGMVIYREQQTLYVTPVEEEILAKERS